MATKPKSASPPPPRHPDRAPAKPAAAALTTGKPARLNGKPTPAEITEPLEGFAVTPPLRHAVLFYRDSGLWVVGPFDTHVEATAYGRAGQDFCGDDPRWQTILLPLHHDAKSLAIPVHQPGDRSDMAELRL